MIIAQISDMHIKPKGRLAYRVFDTAPYLERCIQHINALDLKPDVLLATGDLADAGRPEEYEVIRELFSISKVPIFMIPGNHDDRSEMRKAFPEATYLYQESEFIQYVIEDFPVRLIGLDTLVPGEGMGRLCDERLAWLQSKLAEKSAAPTLIFMHHPPFDTGIGHMDRQGLESSEKLAEIVSAHPEVVRIVCGHVHRSIQTLWAGTLVSIAPSPAHQVAMDLREDGPAAFVMEPPAYSLHFWKEGTGLVTHTCFVDSYAGPYPFYEDGKLID